MTESTLLEPGPLRRLVLRWSVEPSLRRAFREVRHGHRYEPIGWLAVSADDLRVRREPLLIPKDPADLERIYEADVRKATNPIERFFPLEDGKQDRRFRHTPHYELLGRYGRTGEKPYEHDYTRLLVARARMQGRARTEAFLRQKVDGLCRTFDSIRSRGYLAGRYRRYPIAVFESPIYPPTAHYEPRNWEVLDGHHRAASVCVLGIEAVRVLVVRAVKVAAYDLTEDIPWDESRWPAAAL